MAQYSIPTDKEIAEKAKVLITATISQPYSLPSLAVECGLTLFTLERISKNLRKKYR